MSRITLSLLAAAFLSCAQAHTPPTPGCNGLEAAACVDRALEAMGGRAKLEQISNVRLDVISHTALMEQSYRQDPFITAYERDKSTLDLAGARLRTEAHQIWPESDLGEAESDSTLIASLSGGVYHSAQGDTPCSRADLDATRSALALGPLRALLTARAAPDLHYEAPQLVRDTVHTVVAFRFNGRLVRMALNPFNHLPDVLETTMRFNDFWYHWGAVRQQVYWDNWRYIEGVSYPSNEITARNGALWSSAQALDVKFNVALAETDFAMDTAAAQKSLASKGWERPFSAAKDTELAAGIDLYRGSWNTTLIREDDGVVILETPVSATFTAGIFAEAARRYPGEKIRAVLMTSDSWPHVGGLGYDATTRVPLYVLDLNLPLLQRLLASQSAGHPASRPDFRTVTGRQAIGRGANRMELYPLRGASTERQYMVYFPERHLLYASDTLVLNANHTLYDPQLMHEVRQAVEREHLAVETVYAMHEGPTPWHEVVALLDASA